MGRDVSGLRLDRKSSNVVNGTSMNNATDDAAAVNETPPESQFSATEESSDKEEGGGVPGGKNAANHEPEEKIIEEAEIQKLTSPGESAVNGTANGTTENNDAASEAFPKSTDDHSNSSSQPAKKSEQQQSHGHHDEEEEDNWSMASSTATSLRTAKITVPVAPKFTCSERLQRRKEFYSKLEEKHRALEKEKLEYQARIKEEEQAAIKLMRKNMSYKANPVPSFYREGPPPKVELKKLPVTRAKSPVLGRRKSCGDAVAKSTPPEKGICGRGATTTTRHSIGAIAKSKAAAHQNGSSNKGGIQPQNEMKEEEVSDGRGEEGGNGNVAVEIES